VLVQRHHAPKLIQDAKVESEKSRQAASGIAGGLGCIFNLGISSIATMNKPMPVRVPVKA